MLRSQRPQSVANTCSWQIVSGPLKKPRECVAAVLTLHTADFEALDGLMGTADKCFASLLACSLQKYHGHR